VSVVVQAVGRLDQFVLLLGRQVCHARSQRGDRLAFGFAV
jgi:hypothetical protein